MTPSATTNQTLWLRSSDQRSLGKRWSGHSLGSPSQSCSAGAVSDKLWSGASEC